MRMKIEVNGVEHDVREATLEEVLGELGLREAKIATAINGDFVPVSARASRRLQQGDRLEVVSPMQGG